MQSSVVVSQNSSSPQVKPEYLGFQTIINQVIYPIAIIKFTGKDAYCWDWMRGGPGYCALSVDFATGHVENFGKYKESHVSYHESGIHQSRLTGEVKKKLYLARRSITPVAQIQGWVSVTSIPVPLSEPLPHIMKIPGWKNAAKKITLNSCDFGRQDIYLRVYLCRKEDVPILARRFSLGTWVLGSGNIRFVVAADPRM
jgi:hypothetical protein